MGAGQEHHPVERAEGPAMMTATTLLDTALSYARRGWPVFPLSPGTKVPENGSHGVLEATTAEATIRFWWGKKNYNIGIACGPAAGLLIIDIDRDPAKHKHGDADLEDAEDTYGALPETATVLTPSGGEHRYYRHPGKPVTMRHIGHIDIQKEGFYVVAAGSSTKAGEYEWELSSHIDDMEMAELPQAWVDMLTKEHAPPERPARSNLSGSKTVFADFNNKTDLARLLVSLGASVGPLMNGRPRPGRPGGPYVDVVRPGKNPNEGNSARLWLGNPDRLWVWTTSWPDLPACDAHGYSASDIMRITRFNDDAKQFSAWLRDNGYSGDDTKSPPVMFGAEPVAEGDPWPEPIPVTDVAVNLPEFPVGVLPEWMQDQCWGVADEMQVPVDLPAVMGIVALSAAAGGRVTLAARGSWRERLNLYCAVAMPPGAGKSGVFKAMTSPLTELETEARERMAEEIDEAETRVKRLTAAMKKYEDKSDTLEADRVRREIRDTKVPVPPRYIVDDITPEALVRVLGEQSGRLALLSTEGGLFDMMTGRYSDKANLEVYLKAWSGDPIRVTRIGRDESDVKDAALTIGLTVQPSVLANLAKTPELANKGLTPRFMFSMPADLVGRRNLVNPPIADPGVARRYRETMKELATKLTSADGATITLQPDAVAMYGEWRQSLEERRLPTGDLRRLAEWTMKLETSVLRLCGLLYLANGGALHGYVGADSMRRAIAVGEYWMAHQKAVHDMWTTPVEVTQARRMLEWLKENDALSVSMRDLFRSQRGLFARAAEMTPVIDLLTERGWVRLDEPVVGPRGGRPQSPTVRVNPALWVSSGEVVSVVSKIPKSLNLETHSLTLNTPGDADTPENVDTTDTTSGSVIDAKVESRNPPPRIVATEPLIPADLDWD